MTIASNQRFAAAKYQCYVDPESTTGKCPTDGYFTVRGRTEFPPSAWFAAAKSWRKTGP